MRSSLVSWSSRRSGSSHRNAASVFVIESPGALGNGRAAQPTAGGLTGNNAFWYSFTKLPPTPSTDAPLLRAVASLPGGPRGAASLGHEGRGRADGAGAAAARAPAGR